MPFADFRHAHAPIRQPTHRDLVQPRSRVQAVAKSVAAPLVRADARNVEALTDLQPVNTLGNLGVPARLLNSRTEIGVYLANRRPIAIKPRAPTGFEEEVGTSAPGSHPSSSVSYFPNSLGCCFTWCAANWNIVH